MFRTSMQETKVVKTGSRCISRDQRGTLWISWNIGCELVFVKFCQNVKSTFCTISRGFKFGIVYHFPPKTHDGRTVPKEHVLCQSLLLPHLRAVSRNDTNVSSCHTQRDSVRAQALPGQISRLSSQDKRTKSEPKRRRHHDSPPPEQQEFVSLLIASFANPAVKNFFQKQAYVDSFIIAVCCCLSFCCRWRSCHASQTTRVPRYQRHV